MSMHDYIKNQENNTKSKHSKIKTNKDRGKSKSENFTTQLNHEFIDNLPDFKDIYYSGEHDINSIMEVLAYEKFDDNLINRMDKKEFKLLRLMQYLNGYFLNNIKTMQSQASLICNLIDEQQESINKANEIIMNQKNSIITLDCRNKDLNENLLNMEFIIKSIGLEENLIDLNKIAEINKDKMIKNENYKQEINYNHYYGTTFDKENLNLEKENPFLEILTKEKHQDNKYDFNSKNANNPNIDNNKWETNVNNKKFGNFNYYSDNDLTEIEMKNEINNNVETYNKNKRVDEYKERDKISSLDKEELNDEIINEIMKENDTNNIESIVKVSKNTLNDYEISQNYDNKNSLGLSDENNNDNQKKSTNTIESLKNNTYNSNQVENTNNNHLVEYVYNNETNEDDQI